MTASAHITSFKRVWQLAWPAILAGLSVPLLGAVDTAVMGHLPDAAYIGAVAVGAMIFSFLYWGFGFLRMGTTGFTAQALGAGDSIAVCDTVVRALLLGSLLAAGLLILQWPAAWLAFHLLDAEPLVESLASEYFRIRIWGAPATLGGYAVLGWLLGLQRPRTALIIQIITNGLNIGLDLLFVVALGYDVAGVAWATLISEYVGVSIGLAIIFNLINKQYLRPIGTGPEHLSYWNWQRIADPTELRAMLQVNGNIMIRTLCMIFAWSYFTAKGAAIGTTVLAANAILMNFQQFLAYGLDGFAHAAEALVGNAKGANDKHAFRAAIWASTVLAVVVAGGYTVVYIGLAGPIISLLTDLPDVREAANSLAFWLYVSPLISVWSYQLDGIYVGVTRSREMRNGMIISLIVYLAAMAVLPTYFGAHGMWMAVLVFMATRGLTLGFWLPRVERDLYRCRP